MKSQTPSTKPGPRPEGGDSEGEISNKSQIPISNDQNRFGPPEADYLFVIFSHSYHHNRIGITTEKKPSSSSPAIMHALDSSIIFADMTLLVITARISIK